MSPLDYTHTGQSCLACFQFKGLEKVFGSTAISWRHRSALVYNVSNGGSFDAYLQIAGLVNIASNYLIAGKEGSRHGTAHPSIVPYQVRELFRDSIHGM